jgi:tyrosyl-tRNA synthetase
MEEISVLADLRFRGLLNQCTDEPGLAAHLASPDAGGSTGSGGGRRAYVGFDPTADSLTIGNLVGIVALARWQRVGHTPVVVMGGGTGLIGDPSGKSAERQLRTRDEIQHNVDCQRRIFDRVISFDRSRPNAGVVRNNVEWLGSISYLDALRDIGKHFSVNMMMAKDSVRERLNSREQGISYTEFSYMILQAYDFAYLSKELGVTVQMGGSDQFGNIVVGIDLIRRMSSGTAALAPAFGLTWPLVTKADGTKFGKTESGAIWLSACGSGEGASTPNRTSPYAFYQFWLNTADADVCRFLRTFTLLSHAEIETLEAAQAADPGKREAHRALARHMTSMLHGEGEMTQAEKAAAALFSGDVASLPEALLDEVLASAPSSSHDKGLLSGEGVALVDLLAQTTLATSKSQARTFLAEGSVSVNGVKASADTRVGMASLLCGRTIALRRGKKSWHITRWA